MNLKFQKFQKILAKAEQRKGGKSALLELLPPVLSKEELASKGDDRFLAMMCKAINQAGFNWTVIKNKWPQFEEAFYGFDVKTLAFLPLEHWESYTNDKRVVRNWMKIKAVMLNTHMINELAGKHGSFAKFIANWDPYDQVGLMVYLKLNGSRLGGQTGYWFLRYVGKDSYTITRDVVLAIQNSGYDIRSNPTSKRDLNKIQLAFNTWHDETNLPYSHLSRIAAYSIGENYTHERIKQFSSNVNI